MWIVIQTMWKAEQGEQIIGTFGTFDSREAAREYAMESEHAMVEAGIRDVMYDVYEIYQP